MKTGNTVLRVAAVMLLTLVSALAGVRANGSGGERHELSATDLKEKVDKKEGVIILDARQKLFGEIIKGAIHVPLFQVEEWAKTADKNATIVAYCTCPHDETSLMVVQILREMGFQNSFSLVGGLGAARKAGLEIVVPTEK
jgi:rhodanese-related sulfurtransferase